MKRQFFISLIMVCAVIQTSLGQTTANSGILTSPPSTNLKLQTGSTDRLTILNSNGNVGIGTSTPNTKLDIYGGRLTQQGAIPNDNNAVFVNTDATGYGIYSKGGLNTHYAFNFENQAGTSIMYGRGDGNVGIGTLTPLQKLDVNGNINMAGVAGRRIFMGGPGILLLELGMTLIIQTMEFSIQRQHQMITCLFLLMEMLRTV